MASYFPIYFCIKSVCNGHYTNPQKLFFYNKLLGDLFIKNDLTKSEIDSKKAISRLSLIASSLILSLKVWEHTIF